MQSNKEQSRFNQHESLHERDMTTCSLRATRSAQDSAVRSQGHVQPKGEQWRLSAGGSAVKRYGYAHPTEQEWQGDKDNVLQQRLQPRTF